LPLSPRHLAALPDAADLSVLDSIAAVDSLLNDVHSLTDHAQLTLLLPLADQLAVAVVGTIWSFCDQCLNCDDLTAPSCCVASSSSPSVRMRKPCGIFTIEL
jgi:hypothetical protein